MTQWYEKKFLIEQLRGFTYRTPPALIALTLEQIFEDPNTQENHWLYLAQYWNPRAMIRTIDQMKKAVERGLLMRVSPAGYFTMKLKYRKRRSSGFRKRKEAPTPAPIIKHTIPVQNNPEEDLDLIFGPTKTAPVIDFNIDDIM